MDKSSHQCSRDLNFDIYFGRTLLAALDYTENCQRAQKVDAQGQALWDKRTRKWELNAAKLVPVLESKTFGT